MMRLFWSMIVVLSIAGAARPAAEQTLPRDILASDLPRMELVLALSEAQSHAIDTILRRMDEEFQLEFQQKRRTMISERERLFRTLSRPNELPEGVKAVSTWKEIEKLVSRMTEEVRTRNELVYQQITAL